MPTSAHLGLFFMITIVVFLDAMPLEVSTWHPCPVRCVTEPVVTFDVL